MPNLAEILADIFKARQQLPMGSQYGISPAQPQLGTLAPFGMRHDESAGNERMRAQPGGLMPIPKGKGLLGVLPTTNEFRGSTEITAGMNIGGKEREVPLMVPTLTKAELAHLLNGGEPTDSIYQKAHQHATERLAAGLDAFATPGQMYAPRGLWQP